jgi:hypothetical protein
MSKKSFKIHEINSIDINNDRRRSPLRTLLFILITSFITALLLFYYHDRSDTEQSLTHFPDDPALSFESAATSIQFQPGSPYTLLWTVESKINKPTYLRQDVSFLFKDHKLIGILSQWKEKTDEISQMKTFKENESGYFEAISVHHAENHYPNDVIKGKEVMSYDHLSVFNNDGSFTSFRIPTHPNEKRFSQEKWQTLQLKQKDLMNLAAKRYHIDLSQYYGFPLSHIHVYSNQPLPGLSQKTTHRIISQMWEGLYKDYALGIHLSEDDIRDPIGSTMPVILFSKKADHLLIILQLNSGEITLLKQMV